MKVFEERWLKIVDKLITNHCVPMKPHYRAGWKDALKWMEGAIDSCMTVDDVQDVIDKELEGE